VLSVHKTRLDPKELPAVEGDNAPAHPRLRETVLAESCPRHRLHGGRGGLNLSLPWFMRRVVDDAIPRGDVKLLWLYCGAMLAGPAAAGLLEVIQKYASRSSVSR